MRTVSFLIASILSCFAAPTPPSHAVPRVAALGRSVRVSLINMSGADREVVLASGVHLKLPTGELVSVESRVGATLIIVSDTDTRVDRRMLVTDKDDARIVTIG